MVAPQEAHWQIERSKNRHAVGASSRHYRNEPRLRAASPYGKTSNCNRRAALVFVVEAVQDLFQACGHHCRTLLLEPELPTEPLQCVLCVGLSTWGSRLCVHPLGRDLACTCCCFNASFRGPFASMIFNAPVGLLPYLKALMMKTAIIMGLIICSSCHADRSIGWNTWKHSWLQQIRLELQGVAIWNLQ